MAWSAPAEPGERPKVAVRQGLPAAISAQSAEDGCQGGEIEGLVAYASLEDIPVKVERVTLYLPPAVGVKALPSIAAVRPDEFFVNPGAESDELVEEAKKLGLDPILACSIVEIGLSPGQFSD